MHKIDVSGDLRILVAGYVAADAMAGKGCTDLLCKLTEDQPVLTAPEVDQLAAILQYSVAYREALIKAGQLERKAIDVRVTSLCTVVCALSAKNARA